MFDRIVEPNGPEPFKINRAVVQRLAIGTAVYVAVVALKAIFTPHWQPFASESVNVMSLFLGIRWIMEPGRATA